MTALDIFWGLQKTDARPFGVFDVNSGSKKGIVKLLEAICERTTLTIQEWSSKVRLILGDWLISANICAARRDREDDMEGESYIRGKVGHRRCRSRSFPDVSHVNGVFVDHNRVNSLLLCLYDLEYLY